MKTLFIHGGTKYCEDSNGVFYTDGNLNKSIWDRYLKYTDELSVIGRMGKKKNDDLIHDTLNEVPSNIKVYLVDDVYSNFNNYLRKSKVKKVIKEQILRNDYIIIRSLTNFYTLYAAKICNKYKKKYLIEVTGYGFESLWYHNFFGKILALPTEINMKKQIKKADYVLYVSNIALQKRYKNTNNIIGCSDVEILNLSESEINDKIKKISSLNENIKIGTIGNVDNYLKGQKIVIDAIAKLKKSNINFQYEMVGRGNQNILSEYAMKKGVYDKIKFIGEIPHDRIKEWLKTIDIYIQPSLTEGLCRSLIEAMNEGCLIIGSDVGGNFELCDKKYLFKKNSSNQLKNILNKIDKKDYLEACQNNLKKSKKYNYMYLNREREKFYNSFFS